MTAILIVIHALTASGVVLLGPVQLIRRAKDRRHRYLGRSWVVLMYLVCMSGMFIYTLSGAFTIFHALAIFTFGTTTLGVIAIRRGILRMHIGMMTGSWLGAVGAGAFAAIVPGREIPSLAVDDPGLLWSLVAGVIIVVTAWTVVVLRFVPHRDRLRVARAGGDVPSEPGVSAPAGRGAVPDEVLRAARR